MFTRSRVGRVGALHSDLEALDDTILHAQPQTLRSKGQSAGALSGLGGIAGLVTEAPGCLLVGVKSLNATFGKKGGAANG